MFDLTRSHQQPGRRLAPGCNRADTIMAAFGFAAHASLFLAAGAYLAGNRGLLFWGSAAVAAALLVVRARQVGATTTRESIAAIKAAWGLS